MTLHKLSVAALAAAASSIALAAPPKYLTVDHSSERLLDKATAQAAWAEQLEPKLMARLVKLYPVGRWGFLSQVEGGFTADKTCVVTARALMLPRSGKALVFTPKETATAFDAKAGADQAACQALAKAKLGEAISAVLSSLVKN